MSDFITAIAVFVLGIIAISLFALGFHALTNSLTWQFMKRRERDWLDKAEKEKDCADIFKEGK